MAAVGKAHNVWALIVACGKSEQISPEVDTAFLQMGDQPVLAHSLVAFEQCSEIDGILVVAPKDRLDSVVGMARMYGTPKLKKIVGGSLQKTVSIKAGLAALDEIDPSMVVIHESSQPCVTAHIISETIKAARRYGVAVAAQKEDVPVVTVPKGLTADKLIDAGTAWTLAMPVAAKTEPLRKALGLDKSKTKVDDTNFSGRLFKGVHVVPLDRPNLRIRSLADIQVVSTAMRT